MSRNEQDGLGWVDAAVHLIPRWTRQPSTQAVEAVCRQRLGIQPTEPCNASFYGNDAMYKLYSVTGASSQALLMKVLLPVYPHLKTRGEVATLQWVREHTSIPVPKVVAFDDSNDNEIGFEWILMDLVPGVPARRHWRTLAMEKRIAIAQRLADFQAELSRCGKSDDAFRNIGTLDFENGKGPASGTPATVAPSRLVSHEFFMRKRLSYDVPRGPFRSSHDWLDAGLRLLVLEKTTDIAQAQDTDDKEDAEQVLEAAQRLLAFLPKLFTSGSQEDAAVTALYHDGLSLNNILLDDQGEITALLDWECVSAMPAWVATMPPRFLCEETRDEEPKKDAYMDAEPAALDKNNGGDPDELDNEGKNELYWIHLMEYETTQLRRVYRERMRQLWPDWPEEESYKRVDLFEAFLQCNAEVWAKKVIEWVALLEKGESLRWTEVFQRPNNE